MQRVLAGRYRIGRLIGEGGMGAVYEAEHTGLGVRVAVKLLNPTYAINERAVIRFRREARAAAAIKHENIVAVTDADTDEDGVPFIVMEILEGDSLGAWIHRERVLPVATAAAVAAQILAGLAATHEQKVIHRDLKPGNILLARQRDGTFKVKILDFGISKFLEDVQDVTATSVVGTPRFMAPEQALGQKDIDGRVDLYAVGELLYLMTTGRLPFSGSSVETLSEQIIRGDYARPRTIRPELGAALEDVIVTAMATDRNRRYRDANAMLEALRAAVPDIPEHIDGGSAPLSETTPLSIPPSAATTNVQPTNPAPPAPSRRRFLAVGAALVVGAAGVGGLALWRSGHGAEATATASGAAGRHLRFGLSKYLPLPDVQRLHGPFVDYLGRRLGRPVELVVLDDYLAPAHMVTGGELDLAALSAYAYVRAKAETPGLKLLATAVSGGGTSYEGVILVRADSGIATLADLKGKRFCWVSKNSGSGYLYPRAIFRRAGIDPDTAFTETLLTGDHLASLRAVRDRLCDGASVYSSILFEAKIHDIEAEIFRIVASTDRIPYTAYVMSPTAPEELVASMREALLAVAPGSPTANAVFGPGNGQLAGFATTTDAAYDPVRAVMKYLDAKAP
jgi:serine/threonine-protein kinase